MDSMRRWIDMPPVWLALFLMLAWIQTWLLPRGGAPRWMPPVGWGVVCAGLVVGALAVMELLRHRTTVIPHRDPSALVTCGVFAWTRNPIYLGDLLILAGAALILGAIPSVVLVPLFAAVLTRRFIAREEERLRESFGAEFEEYAASVGRWL